MDSAKWKIIKSNFLAMIDLSVEKRARFLQNCDTDIKIEVEKLLIAHEKIDDFIEKPLLIEQGVAYDETNDSLIGTTIENYLILERIGTGGMGAVYLAERLNSDFKQKVALKIIKRGMDSEAILKRFANERRILSTLKHPNIAGLLDGGISKEGQPFFVMEFIDGKPLIQFCNENNLDLKKRLKIFQQVCSAVEHAHRNLIIHRDLKPSNVLVMEDGIPKLLDFGIAKLLSEDEAETTATQAKMFTPEYASPEQILGKNITTSTDIYSLGVILYELLSGYRPYETKGKSYEEIIKSVCENEPTKPSNLATSYKNVETQGEKENPKFKIHNLKSLQGDLDNIILKALRKDPLERYDSVQRFSDDIFRYLTGLPVFARPQTLKYRFGKYVKRHKAGVLAAVFVLLSLIGGTSVAVWQAQIARQEREKAEQRFKDVRQLANSILFDHFERIKNLPGATEAREKLVLDALNYIDKLSKENVDDPDLKRELVISYQKLAGIQGDASDSSNLGNRVAARENSLKALTIQEELVSSNSVKLEDIRVMGKLYIDVSIYFDKENELTQRANFVEKAVNIFKDLKDTNPNQTQAQSDLAGSLWNWANIVRLKGDNDGSITTYLQAAEIYEMLGNENENPQRFKRSAALTYKNIGAVYAVKKDFQNALKFYQKAFAFDKENAANSPNNVQAQLDLSFSYNSLTQAQARFGENNKALESSQAAIDIQEKVLAADVKNDFAKMALLRSYIGIAENYQEMDDFTKAEEFYQKAQKILNQVLEKSKDTTTETNAAIFYKSYGDFFVKKSKNVKHKKSSDLSNVRENLLKAKDYYQTLQNKNVLDPAYQEDLQQIIKTLEKMGS